MGIKQYLEGKILGLMLGQMAESTHLSVFDDPLAEKTEWAPLQRGGANFQTHKLVTVRQDRMEFRTSLGMVLFSLIFVLAGAGVSIGIFLSQEQVSPPYPARICVYGSKRAEDHPELLDEETKRNLEELKKSSRMHFVALNSNAETTQAKYIGLVLQ